MQYVRGQVIAIRPQPYIESAVAVGARTPRILGRHILPHLFAALTSIVALEMGAVLMLLGELGFVSIFIGGGTTHARIPGVRVLYSDVPEWGALLSGQRFLARSYPWTALYPMLAFSISILAFNLLGEGVRRLLEQGTLIIHRLVNRYTVAGTAVAAVVVVWLSANSGVMPFYLEQAGTFDGERAYAHVAALSDPALQGRSLGTQGMADAAQYVADQFEGLGLQSAGQENSYFAQRKRSFARLEAVPTPRDRGRRAAAGLWARLCVYPGLYQSGGAARGPVRFVGLGRRDGHQRRRLASGLSRAGARGFSGEILLTLSPREAEALNVVRKDALAGPGRRSGRPGAAVHAGQPPARRALCLAVGLARDRPSGSWAHAGQTVESAGRAVRRAPRRGRAADAARRPGRGWRCGPRSRKGGRCST